MGKRQFVVVLNQRNVNRTLIEHAIRIQIKHEQEGLIMESKYKMFRNYMHNELGISKEDIREWTYSAVKEVAQDYVKHHFNECMLNVWCKTSFNLEFNNREFVKKAIADSIEKFIKFEFVKESESEEE